MATEVERAGTCPAWAPPLVALQLLTRVPVPALARLPRETVEIALGRSVGWFPLVGAFVGALTAATVLIAGQAWPRKMSAARAVVTGAICISSYDEPDRSTRAAGA